VARKAEKNGLTDSEKQTNINDIRKFVSSDGVLKDHTAMIAAVAALLTAVAALLREIRAWGRRRTATAKELTASEEPPGTISRHGASSGGDVAQTSQMRK
jgi:hypothetical protein